MSTPSYDEIRKRVERRYGKLSWFMFHVVMAITTVAVIWMIDPTPQDGSPVIAVLWFGLIVFHAIKLYIDLLQDREVERLWERYASPAAEIDEKPKRSSRLTDESLFEAGGSDGEYFDARREAKR